MIRSTITGTINSVNILDRSNNNKVSGHVYACTYGLNSSNNKITGQVYPQDSKVNGSVTGQVYQQGYKDNRSITKRVYPATRTSEEYTKEYTEKE